MKFGYHDIVIFLKQKARETGQSLTTVQAQLFQPQPKPQQQMWESLTETPPTQPVQSKAASDDLLQLNAAFTAPLQQPASLPVFSAPVQQVPAFSPSSAFPPSPPFPAAQPFGQTAAPAGFGAAQAGLWGVSASSTGRLG